MATPTASKNKIPGFPASLILKAGLLAGTLDILLAFLRSYQKSGATPEAVLTFISKTAFGKSTFTEPAILIITGLLVHFLISFGWTILFFILYSRVGFMRMNRIVTGIVYGLFIWVMMALVILPLWNNKPFVFKPEDAAINALILIASIGIPLAFMAHAYYSKKHDTA